MKFTPLKLEGAFQIDVQPFGDERGVFARTFCEREFTHIGLATNLKQMNTSFNVHIGTLRGMHYQLRPSAETKIVRCTQGALWDCIVDLRPESPTFKHWAGLELTAENRRMMYVPKGFAHGFITLEKNSEAFYYVDEFYAPDHERGVRWDDPQFGIEWPIEPSVISEKDQGHPDFSPEISLQ